MIQRVWCVSNCNFNYYTTSTSTSIWTSISTSTSIWTFTVFKHWNSVNVERVTDIQQKVAFKVACHHT